MFEALFFFAVFDDDVWCYVKIGMKFTGEK